MPRIAEGKRKHGALAGMLAMGLVVAGCSTGSPLALAPAVDVGVSTAAVPVMPAPAPVPVAVAAPESPTAPPLETAVEQALAVGNAVSSDALEAEQSTLAAEQPNMPIEPVDTAMVVPEPQVVQPRVIEPRPAPEEAAVPVQQDKARGLQTLVPSNPMMVAYPRVEKPIARATGLSADDAACRRDLKKLGVIYKELAPINDGGACRIDHPVLVSAIGNVKMKPAATLNCEMAATFARWTKKELVPSARLRYLSGVRTIHQGSSYSCRRIARTNVASEHSRGNALDVMRIELANGKDIDVRKPGWFAFRQRGLLNNVRADACDYFTTVLGPGYNYDHRNHFHFDIKPRKNGYRACR